MAVLISELMVVFNLLSVSGINYRFKGISGGFQSQAAECRYGNPLPLFLCTRRIATMLDF